MSLRRPGSALFVFGRDEGTWSCVWDGFLYQEERYIDERYISSILRRRNLIADGRNSKTRFIKLYQKS